MVFVLVSWVYDLLMKVDWLILNKMEGYQSEGIELEFSEVGSFIEGYLLEYHDGAV